MEKKFSPTISLFLSKMTAYRYQETNVPNCMRTENSIVLDISKLTGSRLTRFRVCLSSLQYTPLLKTKRFGCGNVQDERTIELT